MHDIRLSQRAELDGSDHGARFEFSGVLSTFEEPENYDSYGTIFAPSVFDDSIAAFNDADVRDGIKILANHNWDAPIGLPLRIYRSEDELRLDAWIDTGLAEGDRTARLIANRIVDALSHGFEQTDFEILEEEITRWGFPVARITGGRLLEGSPVTFPANGRALLDARHSPKRTAIAHGIAAHVSRGEEPAYLVRTLAKAAGCRARDVWAFSAGARIPTPEQAARFAAALQGAAPMACDCNTTRGAELASALQTAIESATEAAPDSDVLSSMAEAAGVELELVSQVLSGDLDCPSLEILQGFADALGVELSTLQDAAELDGCTYDTNEEPSSEDSSDEERGTDQMDELARMRKELDEERSKRKAADAAAFTALFQGAVRRGVCTPKEEKAQRALFGALGARGYTDALAQRAPVVSLNSTSGLSSSTPDGGADAPEVDRLALCRYAVGQGLKARALEPENVARVLDHRGRRV